jgi:DNA-binding transcriptional MocR family regulator
MNAVPIPVDLITSAHPSALRVYAMLAASVDASDSKAASWVSTRSLAKDLHMAQRTVQQALVDLTTQGWLTEIPESDWLPRWRETLADRVQTVRVYGLPRHPVKVVR